MSSFDELLIALFLGGERAATIPKRMWEGLRYEKDPTISVVATILIAFSFTMLFLIETSRRRMNQ
jgi:ABC-type spermidine/putrescine transport system permease subunit II